MNTTLTQKTPPPWYRQGWPWFLIAFPAIAVIAGVITFVIAAKTFDGMVVDDYYKEGRAIVHTIERVERARELGLIAALQVRSESIRIEMGAALPADVPQRIVLTIVHPTRGGQDQSHVLSGTAGVFETGLKTLATGRWLFVIEDEAQHWRMSGSAYLPTESAITIAPDA
ncbi:FixH family protein [Thauera chlorobenzoica]|uniref:FixH family protein n=1 Tax=Thauera chlorobenzoica TaxID=96773 RepID=UPI0008A0921E|nr:FixH family protein [Thauera chlorobenzoica]SEF65493.1 hypothetical protein SAMN05216242_103160 [Thauera chlorobenzoica]